MKFHWYPDALAFCDEYGLDVEIVEAAASNPTTVSTNELSVTKGYPVEDRRRGDVTAVVGLREEEPSILYVRIHLPIPAPRLATTSGTGGGSDLPRTMKGFRSRIREEGYTIQSGHTHDKVLDPDGEYLMTIPVTPSDHRSIANNWTLFRRLSDRRAIQMRIADGSLLEES